MVILSQIIKKVTAELTGQMYMEHEPLLFSVDQDVRDSFEFGVLREYFVGVGLGHTVRIRESEDYSKALEMMRRALTELIFGEFRSDLNKLQYLLYDRDFDGAMKTAKNIEERMFYE